MRRVLILGIVSIMCWGLAMACSGGGAPSSESTPVAGTSGQLGPDGAGGTGDAGGAVGGVLLPALQLEVQLAGKVIAQDGSYAVGKLTAHAGDAKNKATTFHWALIGPGIAGAAYGDGADFAFDLPAVTDKSNYILTLIGKVGGKAVQKNFSFFTVPVPSAKIVANVNQAAGLLVAIADGGAVLKGKSVTFSADAKFTTQYKWQISKDGAKAQDLGTAESATFEAKELGQYQVALQVWGDGGFSPLQYFKFSVEDNAAAIAVISQVTKADVYAGFLKAGGQYPIDSTVTIDASGIGNALASVTCTVKDAANTSIKPAAQTKDQYKFLMNAAGDYILNCTYALKEGYVVPNKDPLESVVGFKILPKAVALATVNGQNCNPATALVFEVGTTVTLSAANSTGNISSYSWLPSAGELKDGDKVDASLKLNDVMGYQLHLNTKGIGDSASVSCMIYAQQLPKAVLADDTTVKAGRSYIFGSYQRAKAKVTQGNVDSFDWSLVNAAGTVLKSQTTQNASDVFEFLLSEADDLTLKLTSKLMTLAGPSNTTPFASKVAQVFLITPLEFSSIQSVAALSDTDVYFASPSAIFHKGVDGRVVQVKNIVDHPALPDGFFARNAGDIYLMTTDGGLWRYTFKDGWVYTALGGTNQALSGPPTGTRLFRVASSRLSSGDIASGTWTKINDGSRYVTTMGSYAYAADAASVANGAGGTDPGIVKCSTSSCSALKWDVDPGAVTWKSIGASSSAVYFSAANGRIYTIQNNLVTQLGSLSNDDYVVAFSRAGSSPYAIGNKGGVYRINTTGVQLYYTAPATVIAASGAGSTFWAWDDAAKVVMRTEKDNLQTVAAQKSLGTPPAGCKDQKQLWTVGDVTYVSVCAVPPGKTALYTIWAAPYQGDLTPNGSLAEQTPVVGVTSDGAGGVLVMRSNSIQQQQADGTLKGVVVPLVPGEVFTGISGKFFITTQGVRVNDGKDYPLVKSVADARYPAALGNVLYYAYGKETRLARVDLNNAANTGDLANVDPADAPIIDVLVDVNQRVYVLTAKTLFRYDNGALAKTYEAPAAMLNSMVSMNGHHLLLSMGLKGLVFVDVDGKVAPQTINTSAETPAAIEITDVGYNGTEFMIFGRDGNLALMLHQFGAPQ